MRQTGHSEDGKFSNSSCLREASAGPVGPLALGNPLVVFPETLFSSGHCHEAPPSATGREAPLCKNPNPWPSCPSPTANFLWPGRPGFQCVIRRVWTHTALPPRCQKFFHSLGEGLLPEGWGPWAPFPSHSSWPRSLCGPKALPPHPALWVTPEQISMWPA